MRKALIKILVTVLILWTYALVWSVLELVFYKTIQPRIVDDIILLLFIPFIWDSITVKINQSDGKE